MKLKHDQRGFVLSGIALLLVLPAMLLAASCFRIIETGGEAVSLQAAADKVFYTGEDIGYVIKNMWDENLLADNKSNANAKFADLADNYRAATGLLVDITPTWMLWIHVRDTEENRYAGTTYCKVDHVAQENWRYYFKDKDDWDYNEPILLVEKLDGKLRITIEEYGGDLSSDVYYSDPPPLWERVGGPPPTHVGENTEVEGVVQLRVFINVRDPRGAAQYESTVDLR